MGGGKKSPDTDGRRQAGAGGRASGAPKGPRRTAASLLFSADGAKRALRTIHEYALKCSARAWRRPWRRASRKPALPLPLARGFPALSNLRSSAQIRVHPCSCLWISRTPIHLYCLRGKPPDDNAIALCVLCASAVSFFCLVAAELGMRRATPMPPPQWHDVPASGRRRP